jgi:hypothetical protein
MPSLSNACPVPPPPGTGFSQNLIAHSGNLITIEFDGKRFGTIQRMSVQDDYGVEPLSGVGDSHVQEYVAGMARHVITVEYAVLRAESMRQHGILPENACERIKGWEFDIVIYAKCPSPSAGNGTAKQDGVCDTLGSGLQTIRKYVKCSYASGSVSVQAHRVVMSDATIYARDVVGRAI